MTQPRSSHVARTLTILVWNVAAVLVGGEIVSIAAAWFLYREDYTTIAAVREDFFQRLPRPPAPDEIPGTIGAPPPDNIERVLHPFFAFTYKPRHPRWKTNNMGFFAAADFPYRRQADELVVAVFGGSLALDLREAEPALVLGQCAERVAASKGYRRATVLLFAQGAWKQPQTMFSFLYYLDTIDMALFLDGFNELAQIPLRDDASAGTVPWDFPAPAFYRDLAASSLRMGDLLLLAEVARTRYREARVTLLCARPVVGRSMLVHMLWRAAVARLERHAQELTSRVAPRREASYPGLFPERATMDSLRREYFSRYAARIAACAAAGSASGKPVFHFLQPNQYVPGSKPPSTREQKMAIGDDNVRAVVERFYPDLRRMCEDLAARGVESHDMTMVFSGRSDTYYRDACCHLNPAGMAILAQAMADRVERSPSLALIPPGPRDE